MRIVVALGGNALLHRGERPDAGVQSTNVVRVADALAALAHDHELVVTHGNEPQLGLLAAQSTADAALTAPYPLDLLGAQPQGLIGSLLVGTLHDVLPGRRIVTVLTHTRVRSDDPAFEHPTTLVGPVYPERPARFLAAKHGWTMAEDGHGWRRLLPAPAATVVRRALVRAGDL